MRKRLDISKELYSKCITSKWGYSSEEAASFLSVIDMASLICSPIWGFVVDKFSFKNRIRMCCLFCSL